MKHRVAKIDNKENTKPIESFDIGKEEEKILKKKNHKFIKGLAIAATIVMIYIVSACILDVYKFFKEINIYAGYASLVIMLLLIAIFVIRPIVVALSTPCFTLDVVDEMSARKASRINHRKLIKVSKNLIKYNKNLSEDSIEKIKDSMDNKRQLNETLKVIYKTEITKEINQIINKTSAQVLAGTAISQNNKFDAATVILLNVRMIMQIVVKCGYHPSYAQLSKLILKVFRNALIAYTIQSMNLQDVVVNSIDKLVKGAISAIPGLSEISKALTQGAANALLTLRVGIITRKYLYKEFDMQKKIDEEYSIDEQIVYDACEEANEDIDALLAECKKSALKKKKQAA